MTHTPGPLEIRRSIKPSDGGHDYAILAEIDGKTRCIGEAIEVVGHGVRVDAEANARLWAAADKMLAALNLVKAALLSDAPTGPQKSVAGDGVIYHLDGQMVSKALNAVRDAIAATKGQSA